MMKAVQLEVNLSITPLVLNTADLFELTSAEGLLFIHDYSYKRPSSADVSNRLRCKTTSTHTMGMFCSSFWSAKQYKYIRLGGILTFARASVPSECRWPAESLWQTENNSPHRGHPRCPPSLRFSFYLPSLSKTMISPPYQESADCFKYLPLLWTQVTFSHPKKNGSGGKKMTLAGSLVSSMPEFIQALIRHCFKLLLSHTAIQYDVEKTRASERGQKHPHISASYAWLKI